ncbi:MAG: hypothetical protein ABMB14_07610 [Myxococcota bacterium]
MSPARLGWALAAGPALVGCAGVPDQDALEVVELELVDASRETPTIGDHSGAPSRTLHTWVWIGPSPGDLAGERPLLLIAHGVDGHPEKFDAFATFLATAGIVVAAPAFPVSNADVGLGLLSGSDLPEQPQDLRFVLDALLDRVADRDDPLWGRFDPEAVVALGHSMGGATLLGLARYGDGEPRIRAEAYLSPAVPLTTVFGPVLDPSGPPTLLMHGLEDETLTPSISEDLYAAIDDPKWYLGIAGAGHSDPVESQEEPPIPSRDAAQSAVRDLIRSTLLGDAGALDATLDRLGADGNTVW